MYGGRVQLRHQYRLCPDAGQRIAPDRVFECKPVVWNGALARIRPVKMSNKLLGSPRGRLAETPCQQVPKNADLGKPPITFLTFLEYKARRRGRSIATAARDFPSSRIGGANRNPAQGEPS